MLMEILDKIYSAKDNVVKYVFKMSDGLITEFSYINKDDGKDIICVSTQTLCVQGCKFCHVSDHIGKLRHRNITGLEMFHGINMIVGQEGLENDCLLVSFMGCGEPLDNVLNVIEAMRWTQHCMQDHYDVVRFAVATMIPSDRWDRFFELCTSIRSHEFQVKIHLSLHYTDDTLRWEWMPNALNIQSAIRSMRWAMDYCNIGGEIHYALIEGVNDTTDDMLGLYELLHGANINIKFLYYNEKDSIEARASALAVYGELSGILTKHGIECEYYVPPGLDVGASCGQFLLDYYEKYNGVTR